MRTAFRLALLSLALPGLAAGRASAQDVDMKVGAPIPAVHRTLFDKGLAFLVESQGQDGSWGNTGVTGICVMAMLASGEDPNFGAYAEPVRKGLRSILRNQDERTGFIRTGLYEHGFAMLTLADAYGAVDDHLLWQGEDEPGPTIGRALEMAVRCAVTSQENNPFKAWQYSPDGSTADTSASGAVLMGLLGARNAGIAVPDSAIDGAIAYYESMTLENGMVNYSGIGGMGDSVARSSICALVLAIAKRRDTETFQAVQEYVVKMWDVSSGMHPIYTEYYRAQALFQVDHTLWRRWTQENTELLADVQREDGAIPIPGASHGLSYSTGMALLSAGLNYCFLPIYER